MVLKAPENVIPMYLGLPGSGSARSTFSYPPSISHPVYSGRSTRHATLVGEMCNQGERRRNTQTVTLLLNEQPLSSHTRGPLLTRFTHTAGRRFGINNAEFVNF
ncbi:hypothetical protein FRC03_008536 [Tulasnella sp. 419]|nr:hypothetical protein FRC03_008536 [Tulasnella sp. 419]